jgi:hypothetical protein
VDTPGPRDKRIVKHIAAIKAAGMDIEKFEAALRAVRDDPQLSGAMREAIWKTLAQEAAQAYYVFTTGKPLDMDAMIAAFERSQSE